MATCKANKKSYIGKTKHSLPHRRKQHYSAASYGSNAFFHRAIRKYGKDSFEWRVLFSSQKEEELLQKEKDMIEEYVTILPAGYNMTSGGERNYNTIFSDEWKRKNQERADALGRKVYCIETDEVYCSYAEASRKLNVSVDVIRHCCRSKYHLTRTGFHFCYGNQEDIEKLKLLKEEGILKKKRKNVNKASLKGRKMSEKFCERRREIMIESHPWKGKHHSAEKIEQMRRNRIGKNMGKDNQNSKKVICIETGEIYDSMSDAARALGIKNGGGISACCCGTQKTACGYHWQYA